MQGVFSLCIYPIRPPCHPKRQKVMMSILRASLLMAGAPLLILSAAPMASGLPVGRELADRTAASTVKHIGKETQAATGVKVSTGLPGVTPAKKSVAAANAPTPIPASAYNNYRMLLQDALCPEATEPEIKVRTKRAT